MENLSENEVKTDDELLYDEEVQYLVTLCFRPTYTLHLDASNSLARV